MRTKRNRKGKGTKKRRGGGIFDWFYKKKDPQDDTKTYDNITKSIDSIVYLDPIKSTNIWSCIFLPPYVSSEQICARINEISKALASDRGGPITKCKFNDNIRSRINTIITNSNKFKGDANNFKLKLPDSYDPEKPDPQFTPLINLYKDFIEIQLYILVCRNQMTNRGIGLDLLGKIVF